MGIFVDSIPEHDAETVLPVLAQAPSQLGVIRAHSKSLNRDVTLVILTVQENIYRPLLIVMDDSLFAGVAPIIAKSEDLEEGEREAGAILLSLTSSLNSHVIALHVPALDGDHAALVIREEEKISGGFTVYGVGLLFGERLFDDIEMPPQNSTSYWLEPTPPANGNGPVSQLFRGISLN